MGVRQAKDGQDRIRALLPEAFRLAKEHEPRRTKPIGGIVWKEGARFHERTFDIVRRVGEDQVIISGWPDGHEGEPVEREVPWADIVDGGNLVEAMERLMQRPAAKLL